MSILFFSSCTNTTQIIKKSNKLTEKEKHDLNLFFKHLLLREEGIYVLLGSKPLASCQAIYMPKHEQIKEYEKLNKELRENVAWVKIAFDFQWWENVRDKIKPTQYLIFQKNTSHPKVKDVFIVSIRNTALVLQKNYELFKEIVGYDFAPWEIVFEIEKESSDFWNKVFEHSVLLGIVFGYGLDNACLFNWMYQAKQSSSENIQNYANSFSKIFRSNMSDHDIKLILSDSRDKKLNYQDFPLPCFRSLQDSPQKEKYIKEQKKIKKIYRGRDSLEVTLQKLCE